MDILDQLQRSTDGLFAEALGVRFLEAGAERIVAEVRVEDRHCTVPGRGHGGFVMAFADTLGAYGTALNLSPDAGGTTTIESKTNFFGAAPVGATLRGESTPLHRGARTQVWQTRVTNTEGDRLVAIVTQTQMVFEKRLDPTDQLSKLFEGGDTADHQTLLARLERAGAGFYERWAAEETDPEVRERLEAASRREVENAVLLEEIAKER